MSTHDKDQLEALQAVVDRVSAYQDGAPQGTVETELRSGFAETGIDVTDQDVTRVAEAIEAQGGDVSVATVLGA